MVRLTLLINLLALGVVVAILLQLELPAAAGVLAQANGIVDDLGTWASLLWDTVCAWAAQLAPWFESAWEKVVAWSNAAAQWTLERVQAVSDWITSNL